MKRLYCIEYGHTGGYGEPNEIVGRCRVRAFDPEHALERFHDSDEGFAAFRIAHVPEGREAQPHRWHWQDVPDVWSVQP